MMSELQRWQAVSKYAMPVYMNRKLLVVVNVCYYSSHGWLKKLRGSSKVAEFNISTVFVTFLVIPDKSNQLRHCTHKQYNNPTQSWAIWSSREVEWPTYFLSHDPFANTPSYKPLTLLTYHKMSLVINILTYLGK